MSEEMDMESAPGWLMAKVCDSICEKEPETVQVARGLDRFQPRAA
jgi:hypothetical protein